MEVPGLALVSVAAWRVAKPTEKPAKPDVEGIYEEGVGVLPVRVVIFQYGLRTGWDDGALGFEEGAVWFSGRATSFRIARADALPPGSDGLSDHTMVLRHPKRRVTVELHAAAYRDRSEWRDALEIASRFRRFWREEGGEGMSQYPPLTPRPGILPTQRRDRLELWMAWSVFVAAGISLAWRPSSNAFMMLPAMAMSAFNYRNERDRRRTLARIVREEQGD